MPDELLPHPIGISWGIVETRFLDAIGDEVTLKSWACDLLFDRGFRLARANSQHRLLVRTLQRWIETPRSLADALALAEADEKAPDSLEEAQKQIAKLQQDLKTSRAVNRNIVGMCRRFRQQIRDDVDMNRENYHLTCDIRRQRETIDGLMAEIRALKEELASPGKAADQLPATPTAIDLTKVQQELRDALRYVLKLTNRDGCLSFSEMDTVDAARDLLGEVNE